MIHDNHFTSIILILIVSSSLINVSQSSEAGNWFTKSLDYYSLEKCSPLDKSGVAGDFHGCLNSPVDPSSSSTGPTASSSNGKGKSGNWGSSGSNGGVGGFGSSGDFSGQSGFGSKKSSQSTSADSWPLSLITDLQHMINCFPKLIKPCMTESEVKFFTTIKNFFQAQIDYASPNASLIAERISSSRCVKTNSIDTNTICYSTNIHKQNWFGWKINWIDGQMCRFIDDISKCEVSSFDKCSSDIKQFADGLWEAGLKVTPCLDKTDETTSMSTTLSSPSSTTSNPVDQQTKILAPGSSVFKVDPNQSPKRLTNVTNINSNDKLSLGVTVNKLTVNNNPVEPQNQEDQVQSKTLIQEKHSRQRRFFDKINMDNDDFGFDQEQQFDFDNNNDEENEEFNENGFEIDEKTKDFKGRMKNSKRVRLHEVDGEGESRHDYDERHSDIAEEQWSRIKEEFRRKMRESSESRESDESEYEEESEESDEDKNFDIFENRKTPFGLRQRNEEDEYRENRKNRKDSRMERFEKSKRRREEEEKERQRKRNEFESERRREDEERQRNIAEETLRRMEEVQQRKEEIEERIREGKQRRLEEEERRRENEQRKLEEIQRAKEEGIRKHEEEQRKREKIARKLEEERRERKGWEDNDNDNNEEDDEKKIIRPQRFSKRKNEVDRWNNNQRNVQLSNSDHNLKARDCFISSFNSWSSKDKNSDDIMDLMCRNMDSIHSCLDQQQINGQSNPLGHLKMIKQTICDDKNKFNDNIEKVKQCLTGQKQSSTGNHNQMQTKFPNRSRLWN